MSKDSDRPTQTQKETQGALTTHSHTKKAKKVKETRIHGETERTSGLEDEQKEGRKRQSRHSKRENVELVEVNVKSSRSEVSK